MMENTIVIRIVVAMALSVVITGSTLTAVSAQGNLTSGGANTTAGGGDIAQQLKSAAAAAQVINDKKVFLIICDQSMTDPNTQCIVSNVELERR